MSKLSEDRIAGSLRPSATQPGIWQRIIQPQLGGLSPTAAEAILQLRLPEADSKRVDELSEKARDGTLSPEETDELDNFLHVGRTLELLKSKARQSLRPAGAA
jgi:hypothetical protein